ncbi:membrane or secreted protein [Algibacter aquimarinus]|uniref:Membrane or secreted protein n=1 Tax=Algibacter aquimarinus TaxID=1136748 RepID=A0ABP9HG95_9FLAO
MKQIFFLLVSTFLSISINGQSFIGAWEATSTSNAGVEIRNVVIFSEGYQVATWYEAKTGKFLKTNGGTWKLESDTMTEVVEFDSENPDRVGTELSFKVRIDVNTMGIIGDSATYKRIDDGSPGKLQNAWLMSGRVRNGETQLRDVNRPRKTMKILSGTRFQWIAYNTETKKFSGTGGGTYTTIDGKYTENIEFFSKDNSKVGMSLDFNYSIDNGNWTHTGFTSKGDPLHEIWSVRE